MSPRKFETVAPLAERRAHREQAAQQAFEFRGPLFRTDEAAAYLHYRGRHQLRSLYRYLALKGIPAQRRCRTLLIKKADLDRSIGAATRRAV